MRISGFFLLFFFVALLPFEVKAEEFHVRIEQEDHKEHVLRASCQRFAVKCKGTLPIYAIGEDEKTEITVDFFIEENGINFQFYWRGDYLFSDQKALLYIPLYQHDRVTEQDIFLYVPSKAEREDGSAEAVMRRMQAPVADLRIVVERL